MEGRKAVDIEDYDPGQEIFIADGVPGLGEL